MLLIVWLSRRSDVDSRVDHLSRRPAGPWATQLNGVPNFITRKAGGQGVRLAFKAVPNLCPVRLKQRLDLYCPYTPSRGRVLEYNENKASTTLSLLLHKSKMLKLNNLVRSVPRFGKMCNETILISRALKVSIILRS